MNFRKNRQNDRKIQTSFSEHLFLCGHLHLKATHATKKRNAGVNLFLKNHYPPPSEKHSPPPF